MSVVDEEAEVGDCFDTGECRSVEGDSPFKDFERLPEWGRTGVEAADFWGVEAADFLGVFASALDDFERLVKTGRTGVEGASVLAAARAGLCGRSDFSSFDD